jgi:2-desacetyl-2-hydroxyethyl bacteriochlorophyllide A dehydrogenase
MARVAARTVIFTGPRTLEVRELPLRTPGPEDLVISTWYSGISAGTEMNVYRGAAPQWRTVRDRVTGLFAQAAEPEWTYPLAYGYAAVGAVEEAGGIVGAGGPGVGDLVFTYTAHAEASVVRAGEAVVLPRLADPRTGVLFANLNTALNGVLDARPNFGDTVVVSGLGVVGLLVVQILRRTGVSLIVGVDALPHRRAAAKCFGADVVLVPGDGVAGQVRELTENRGADIVIEVSGASAALNEAIRIAGFNAAVVAMSWYAGTFESLSLSGEFHHNRPRIISSQVGAVNPDLGPLWTVNRRTRIARRLLTELDLAPLFTHVFPVEEAGKAYAAVDEGADDLIQCVLSYPDGEARWRGSTDAGGGGRCGSL